MVVALPELWAAFGGSDVFWPTISATIGNLEVSHVWVALIVAGVLVWGAYQAFRVTKEKLRLAARAAPTDLDPLEQLMPPEKARLLEDVDRFTVAKKEDEADVNPRFYLAFAVVAVALPSAAFRTFYDGDDRRYIFAEVLAGDHGRISARGAPGMK